MGSGTTIQAAINKNRKFIGIEKEKKKIETAKTRLNLLL
jgi:DNA modification methylase